MHQARRMEGAPLCNRPDAAVRNAQAAADGPLSSQGARADGSLAACLVALKQVHAMFGPEIGLLSGGYGQEE
jgi:hypothetical protein